jgi:hypothetical protein
LRKKGKSLKGFFKGTSSRNIEDQKKASVSKSMPPKVAAPTTSEPPAAVTTTPAKKEDDTVYGIELDTVASEGLKTSSSDTDAKAEQSEKKDTTSTTEETASKTSEADPQDPAQTPGLKTEEKIISNTVQIILLLMDPISRRFELLQLEFDSVKAIVQDLLSQIPSSATEESVRDQGYDGICTIGGVEMTCTGKLKDFVEQNEGINSVVLAMPEGVSPEECAKMAKPILSDKNVASMLDPSGATHLDAPDDGKEVKLETAEDPAEKATTDVADESSPPVTEGEEPTKETTEETSTEEDETLSKKKPSLFGNIHSLDEDVSPVPLLVLAMSIFFLPSLAFVLYRRHSIISAPFSTGDIITPGVTRSHCGLFEKVPFVKCEPRSVSFDEDGVLSLYHGDEVQWQMKGGKCDGSSEAECIVEISANGDVMIAGKKARMEGDTNYDITPWPFADEVSVKTKFGRKK